MLSKYYFLQFATVLNINIPNILLLFEVFAKRYYDNKNQYVFDQTKIILV